MAFMPSTGVTTLKVDGSTPSEEPKCGPNLGNRFRKLGSKDLGELTNVMPSLSNKEARALQAVDTGLHAAVARWDVPELAVKQIAAGRTHSLALLKNGTVRCWGNNRYDQAPPVVSFPGRRVVQITTGGYHSLALLDDGTVRCWGMNHTGQAPDIKKFREGEQVVQIAAGFDHSLALLDDGTVRYWGLYQQLPRDLKDVVQIAVGLQLDFAHKLALLENGTISCWGDNSYGQAPPKGVTFLAGEKVVQITTGKYHSLALLDDGTVKCWGDNHYKQAPPEGVTFLAEDKKIVQIAAGENHSLALLDDGTVRSWGKVYKTKQPRHLKHVVHIAAGCHHSLALLKDGKIIGWGRNYESQSNDQDFSERSDDGALSKYLKYKNKYLQLKKTIKKL